jgi:hypothetical protein
MKSYHNTVPSSSSRRTPDFAAPVEQGVPDYSVVLQSPGSFGLVDLPNWRCCFGIELECSREVCSCPAVRPNHYPSSGDCPRRRRLCDLERSSPWLPLRVSRVTLGAGAALRLNDPPICLHALVGFVSRLYPGRQMLHEEHEQRLRPEGWCCASVVEMDVA